MSKQHLGPNAPATKLFDSIMSEPMALLPIQNLLAPEQTLAVIRMVTNLTLKKPIERQEADTFLLSLDDAQILVLKRHFTSAQIAFFESALIEATDTVRDVSESK